MSQCIRFSFLLMSGLFALSGCGKKESGKKKAKPAQPKKPPVAKPAKPTKLGKVNLPQGRSLTTTQADATVTITTKTMGVNGKALGVAISSKGGVVPGDKADGPEGFLVKALYEALTAEWKKIRKSKGRRLAAEATLAVRADRKTPTRVLAEALYTARQAKFVRYLLAVQRPDKKEGGVLVEWYRKEDRKRRRYVKLNLTVVKIGRPDGLGPNAYYLKSRYGSECPEGAEQDARLCFACNEGKCGKAALKLQKHLWYLHAKKYRKDKGATPNLIRVLPEPLVPLSDVILTLEAARDVPADAKRPKPPRKMPAGGCVLERDKDLGTWGPTSASRKACMYYRLVLLLGTP